MVIVVNRLRAQHTNKQDVGFVEFLNLTYTTYAEIRGLPTRYEACQIAVCQHSQLVIVRWSRIRTDVPHVLLFSSQSVTECRGGS